MWSKPKRSLGLVNPSQGFSLPLSVPLPPERLVGVRDAVALAVGLDRLYAEPVAESGRPPHRVETGYERDIAYGSRSVVEPSLSCLPDVDNNVRYT